MSYRLRVRALAASLPLLVVLAACGGDDGPTDPGSSVTGTWVLRTVNGTALPVTLVDTPAGRLELLSDRVTLDAAGAYVQTSVTRTTISAQPQTDTASSGGRYSVSGGTVVFTDGVDASRVTGTLANGAITIAGGGLTLVYQR